MAIIKDIIDVQDINQLGDIFENHKKVLEAELAVLTVQAKQLDSMRDIVKEDMTIMNYHVSKKEIPARQVISLRKKIAAYQDEGLLW